MTTLDKHGFTVASIGSQSQSCRKNQTVYVGHSVTREQRDKVFISHDHSKAFALGRESPIGGPIYNLPETLNVKSGVAFTKGEANAFGKKAKDQDGIPTNDELQIEVDSQQFKYGRDPTMLIGTEPRGRLKDAELIKNHAAAFFSRDSPGPAAIGEAFGPKFTATKPRMGNAMPFGVKLKSEWQRLNNQPDNVGPNLYIRKDVAVGNQHLSHRKNQPVNKFGRGAQGGTIRNADSISILDAAKSSLGKQVLSRNKSDPTVGFGRGTRDQRGRTAMCMTREDQGPKAFMPKQHMSMPRLPMESEVMRSGWSGIGTG